MICSITIFAVEAGIYMVVGSLTDAAGNVGGRPISGTGGQLQFTLGAMMAKGGRAILAATARDAKGKSRFVPMLDPGSVVAVPDWLVTYVCTEYGIVNLMGCTDAEKAAKLISIAHPDDREWLAKEAVDKLKIKLNHWMFKSAPDRRFRSPGNAFSATGRSSPVCHAW